MTTQIPSAEKLAAFVADSSVERIKEITGRVKASMLPPGLPNIIELPGRRWTAESAAQFLGKVWGERDKWWKARFEEDETLKWLISQDAIDRSWHRATQTRKLRHLNEPCPTCTDWQQHAVKVVEEGLRSWSSRVIAQGKQSSYGDPLLDQSIESRANAVTKKWKWIHGVAQALHDYLYADIATALIDERKNIRAMHAEAIRGLIALEAFAETHFSRHFTGSSNFWKAHNQRKDRERRIALEILGDVSMEDFYPSARQDATAGERLLVASLAGLHRSLFRVPKPEAIVEIMNAPFIRNPIDLRTVERICSTRIKSLRSIANEMREAEEQYRNRGQLSE